MVVNVLYGFDTERPWRPNARRDLTKADGERERNLDAVARIGSLMDSYGAGRTFFILGDYIELSEGVVGGDHLRQVFQPENPLVEIGQHTHNHVIVAPIKTRPDRNPVGSVELESELRKANSSLHKVFGIEAVYGLRTPLGYVHGTLNDFPDVTNVIKGSGLKYVSSSLRNAEWGINAPLKENGQLRQPFNYANGLLEVPSHGWQDSAFTGASKTQGTDDFPTTVGEIGDHYIGLIRDAIQEAGRLSGDPQPFFVGLCLHPWAIRRYDPNLEVLTRLLDFTSENDMENESYKSVLDSLS